MCNLEQSGPVTMSYLDLEDTLNNKRLHREVSGATLQLKVHRQFNKAKESTTGSATRRANP